MSSLIRTSFRTASSRMQFTKATSQLPRAAFSTTIAPRKGPVETVKETAKGVDRAVSDKLVEGIEMGEKAAGKAKQAAGVAGAEAKEFGGSVKGKAGELREEAKQKERELKSKI